MSNYVPNNFLRKTVEKRDADEVRGALVALILIDSSFSKGIVYQAIKYAEENGIEVYQEHNSSIELTENAADWNEDYFAKIANQLRRNFSKERLSHLEKVGKKAYITHIPTNETKTPSIPRGNMQSNRTYRQTAGCNGKTEPKKNFLIGRQAIAVVAAGIAVAAIIILITKN